MEVVPQRLAMCEMTWEINVQMVGHVRNALEISHVNDHISQICIQIYGII